MAQLLSNLWNTVIAGFVLAAVLFVVVVLVSGAGIGVFLGDQNFWQFFFRWLHVVFGILWIGLLYYFNFVQVPMLPKIPDEQKPAITKVIAPEALWYFRWAALFTLLTGLVVAMLNGYLVEAMTIGAIDGFTNPRAVLIGIGMWLGIIMAFNVWFIIWPNQQKALNIANAFPDLTADQRGVARVTAMQFSRVNLMLSVPMLFSMTGAQNIT